LTHCQLDAKSVRALSFSKPAQFFWNIGVLRLDKPLSTAHYQPRKSQNCQERRLQVKHFTPSIPHAKYRLRKQGCVQKGNFRYLWVKKSWHFYLSLSLLPSFFFILVQFFGLLFLFGFISVGNVLGNSRLTGLEEELQVGSGVFSSPFSAQLYIFFVFLSGLLDSIVRAFYFIFSFISDYFATENNLQVK